MSRPHVFDPPTVPIPLVKKQGVARRAATTFIRHPVWSTAGALLGVIGTFISIYQLAGGQNYDPADLEVAIVAMGTPQEIEATVTYPGNDVVTHSITGAPVDITLKNNGSDAALITAIDAKVLYYKALKDCVVSGAGPGVITAYYSIKIPMPENNADPVAPGPYSTSTRFEVKPNSVDRMQLTIGPEEQNWATDFAKVMAVQLTLVHDDGERLDVGTVELASTGENVEKQIERSTDQSCAQDNMRALDELYAIQGYHAPDLDKLRDSYSRLSG